jgi:hypothetical protein
VDALQQEIELIVGQRVTTPRGDAFLRVRELAYAASGLPAPNAPPLLARAAVPYLDEPWYC